MGLDWNKIDKMIEELDPKGFEEDNRVIHLRRRELVWETRECDYTEKDFMDWKTSAIGTYNRIINDYDNLAPEIKSFYNKPKSFYIERVEEIQKLTFTEIVRLLTEEEKLSDEEIDKWEWFIDDIKEDIRQKNYDAPVSDTDYYGDFDEEWSLDGKIFW